MKITKLIKELEKKLEKYGDILCYANAPDHPDFTLLDRKDINVDSASALLGDARNSTMLCHIGGLIET